MTPIFHFVNFSRNENWQKSLLKEILIVKKESQIVPEINKEIDIRRELNLGICPSISQH